MAEDTRKDESAVDSTSAEDAQPRNRKHRHPDLPKTQTGKLWEAFGNPEEPVNQMPGGTYNSAGGRPKEVTWRDAFHFESNDWQRFRHLAQMPCVRDSLLVGMGGGLGVGGIHAVLKGFRGLRMSANIAVGTFGIIAVAMYKWCDNRRQAEQKGMAEALIMMKKLQDKKKQEEAAEKAKEAEEARRREEERKKAWFRWS
ncbi:MAG: hypothetical protein Q9227_005681 [Pyrenula ochraceoflavens]